MLEAIDLFKSRLKDAVADGDWDWAERCSERLKTMLFSAVVAKDAKAIDSIREALSDAGARVEIANALVMSDGPSAAAWRLRADAGTANLARRYTPDKEVVAFESSAMRATLEARIMQVLREANAPLTNQQLAQNLQADEGGVSKTLSRLERHGAVQRQKVGRQQFNRITERGRRLLGASLKNAQYPVINSDTAPTEKNSDPGEGGIRDVVKDLRDHIQFSWYEKTGMADMAQLDIGSLGHPRPELINEPILEVHA